MRLIFAFLATAQLRLARFDLARSEMLLDESDAAFDRARQRVVLGNRLAGRAGLKPLRVPTLL